MTAEEDEANSIRAYVERQADEKVIHLEKAASELVGPARHDIWDVHCQGSRWWVVTNPTNLYPQQDFKSRDVALTFHIGLSLRVLYMRERQVPVAPEHGELLPGAWRRWEQAFETYDSGDEAENFQAVGMRLRECLVSFVDEMRNEVPVPDSSTPKGADVKAWCEIFADALAAGSRAVSLRSYLKKMAKETWEYVNWLTHAKNAIRLDAEIALKAVEHLLGTFTAAWLRRPRVARRCADCASYDLVGGVCRQCGWADSDYKPPEIQKVSDEERARRLAEPCTPSSDISTFMRPEDVMKK